MKLVDVVCNNCNKTFKKNLANVKSNLKRGRRDYCSTECVRQSNLTLIKLNCQICEKEFFRNKNQFEKFKNHFCSQSCSGKYINRTRKTGTRISYSETYLSNLIVSDFPDLVISRNNNKVLPDGLEIDIYLPELNIAIELNGPIHYKPIYGLDKLELTILKDKKKLEFFKNSKYKFIVLDISKMNSKTKQKDFLDNYYKNNLKKVITAEVKVTLGFHKPIDSDSISDSAIRCSLV